MIPKNSEPPIDNTNFLFRSTADFNLTMMNSTIPSFLYAKMSTSR